MKKIIDCMALAVAGSALAGCATTPVLEQRLGPALADDISYSYDSSTDTVTLMQGGADLATLTANGSLGTASLYTSSQTVAMRRTTASGKGEVTVLASADADFGIVGAIASRAGTVGLPATGSANFKGGYSSLLITASDKVAVIGITGVACLNANFAARSIGGQIIARNGFDFNNVTIIPTPITPGGSFSTSATGGESTVGTLSTTSNGAVQGMFADVAAGEIVGMLRLDHDLAGTAAYEIGGFTTLAGSCP